MNGQEKIAKLSTVERLKVAKAKTQRLVDHALYVLELHENNAITFYSPILASQIPTSHAANAFITFRHALHQFEMVRLCALWDGIDLEKENIPTVIELIDHPDVIEALGLATESHWKGHGGHTDLPDDPELLALFVKSNEEYGAQQGTRTREEARKAIQDGRKLLHSAKLTSIMNLRDKYLAHSLTETRRERKVGPLDPVKYGDERAILDASLPIVQALHSAVNGTGFDFENSRLINQKNAKALWETCTFNVKY
jgi:hypothetical protein